MVLWYRVQTGWNYSKNAIEKFRGRYRELFGAASGSDGLYESVSSGNSFPGMEHWLPLFYGKMDTIFSYTPGAAVSLGVRKLIFSGTGARVH